MTIKYLGPYGFHGVLCTRGPEGCGLTCSLALLGYGRGECTV